MSDEVTTQEGSAAHNNMVAQERATQRDARARVLARSERVAHEVHVFEQAQALQDEGVDAIEQSAVEDRHALRRVEGLSTELKDVTEVEYRRLRLERVVLIGVYAVGDEADAQHSLAELAALAETAGSDVLDGLLQRRPHPDPSTYFGRGKAEELRAIVAELEADTVIADTELAPSQRRALEDVVKVKVVDRTALILDIFAQHASSREGKAQVELAQLEYMLPRLRGWGGSLSRQAGGRVGAAGGGIGSRGPGETKIELDRRVIHTRMARLRKQIAKMAPARQAKRANRRRYEVPSVAFIGYTNAGKSSLLNAITGSDLLVENALFATLDSTVRRHLTTTGREYTMTDTVGFVRSLPHQLVEAFRSTFEEAADADVLVHVVDATHPDPAAQIDAVHQVLAESEISTDREIIVFNKIDQLAPQGRLLLRGLAAHSLEVSAHTGEGLEELVARIEELLPNPAVELELLVPFDHGEVLPLLHEHGRVLAVEYESDGTHVHAEVPNWLLSRIDEFREDTDRVDTTLADATPLDAAHAEPASATV